MATNKSGRVENAVIYAYLFLLPFNSGLLRDSLHSLSSSISFIPHLVGVAMMAMLIYSRKRDYHPSAIVKKICFIILLLNLSSLIMAIIQFKELGTLFGRNTFVAAAPHFVYYLQILLAVLYNDYIFSRIEVGKVIRILLISFAAVAVIGYAQIVSLVSGNGLANALLDFLSRVFFFDEVYVYRIPKLNLMTPEASTAGAQIAVFILPLLLALVKHERISRKLGIGLIVAFIPIVIFNNSSSGFLGVLITFASFLFLLAYRRKIPIWNVRIVLILSLLLAFLLNFDSIVNSDFFQRTFLKAVDTENLSTLHRTTSIYTNMESLKDYPILGVGNGIQGFYYIKYFPNWGFQSLESIELYYGESGWPGSGAFIFTYLSAYGIFGVLLLAYVIYLVNRNIRALKNTSNHFVYDFAIIGSISLLFQAYSTIDIIGNFYAIFFISLAALRQTGQEPAAEDAPVARCGASENGYVIRTAVRGQS